jgi:hypothetical protein
MYGALSYGALAVAVLMGTTACVVRTRANRPTARVRVEAHTPPPPSANVTIRASQPTAASGVTIVESSCQQGAPEQCNGLDDNCDGVIDEGCGYQSGNIQITLGWHTGADLDMYVTEPSGNIIYYGASQSGSGGHLDHDARGACADYQPGNYNVENVYWDMDSPPPGQYSVEVKYWNGGACSGRAGATQFTLSVAVGGQLLGTWSNNITPGAELPVVNFNI